MHNKNVGPLDFEWCRFERKLIGEFQALQFRSAHLYSELEIAREDAEPMVSVAKAKAGRASLLAVQEGVQMHGGISMTDDI